MRKCLIIALISGTLSSVFGQNYILEGEKLSMLFRPFYLLEGTFNVGVEKYIMNGKNGIFFSSGITYFEDYNESIFGGIGELQYRHYFAAIDSLSKTSKNLYVGPFIQSRYHKTDYHGSSYYNWNGGVIVTEQPDRLLTNFALGILVGLKIKTGRVLLWDMFFGGGFRYTDVNGMKARTGDVWRPEYTGIIPRIGFSAGILL